MNRTVTPPLTLTLSEPVLQRLRKTAAALSLSQSEIADEALKAFFDPKPEAVPEPLIAQQLDELKTAIGALSRDVIVIAETLAVFVRWALADEKGTNLKGTGLAGHHFAFERFVAEVGVRLACDQRLILEVLERIATEKPHLFPCSGNDGTVEISAAGAQA